MEKENAVKSGMVEEPARIPDVIHVSNAMICDEVQRNMDELIARSMKDRDIKPDMMEYILYKSLSQIQKMKIQDYAHNVVLLAEDRMRREAEERDK